MLRNMVVKFRREISLLAYGCPQGLFCFVACCYCVLFVYLHPLNKFFINSKKKIEQNDFKYVATIYLDGIKIFTHKCTSGDPHTPSPHALAFQIEVFTQCWVMCRLNKIERWQKLFNENPKKYPCISQAKNMKHFKNTTDKKAFQWNCETVEVHPTTSNGYFVKTALVH